jgi:septal ring factor EnvC (AmiA/AmiB activator)
MTLRVCVCVCALVRVAAAGRPADAILEERAAAEAELRDLERRARALDDQAAQRRDRLRRRVRALYKLSNGGALRLIADAGTREAMLARYQAAQRIVARDLDELAAVRDEARALDEDQARRAAELALALEQQMSHPPSPSGNDDGEPPRGLLALAGRLPRPVAGAVVGAFGTYRDPELRLELSRRGVELRSVAGEPVRAVAAGQVRYVGAVAGLGRGVIVDHGDGYLTLTARLSRISVEKDATIAPDAVLGHAAGDVVYFELSQGGTPYDPAPWLAPRPSNGDSR